MPLVCIQCAMQALLDGTSPPSFEETAEEHMARVHPNPAETQRVRAILEVRLAAKLKAEGKG